MSTFNRRIRALAGGVLITLTVSAPVLADDSEIYSSQSASTGAKPNVLFIMDTSGSMDSDVQQSSPPYDPKQTYTGTCSSSYYYWSRSSDTPPSCSTTSQRVLKTAFKCAAASTALADGSIGTYPGLFNSRERFAQFHSGTWEQTNWTDSDYVDCISDEGVDGLAAGDGKPYLRNGSSSKPYSASSQSVWTSTNLSKTYRIYTANYTNYAEYVKNNPPPTYTRLEIVRNVALSLASSLQNVNLGLMRYSTTAQGGYVLSPIKDIATNRTDIITKLNALDASGYTPLSETLYEAALYLTGSKVDYGANSTPGKSSDTDAVLSGKYVSPIQYSCQKNYIVYLTDGAPTQDDDANAKIASMIGKSACAADSSPPFHDGGWTTYSGVCMDDLAAWMSSPDTDLGTAATATGKQNALTYMIGFGDSVAASVPYLDMVAKAGGTDKAYTAADVDTLTTALQQIFSSIQEDSSTFVTPSISVNAFNRAQTDQDLYFSLFKASSMPHWPGNLKKYKLSQQNQIIDVNAANAVGSDGFFADSARSFWSPTVDGGDVTLGGAASQQVVPKSRVIYTQLGSTTLKGDTKNLVDTSNSLLTDAIVGTGTDTAACSTTCQNAINWLRGVDINDDNKDGKTDDQHKFMGDPLHGRPAVVPYGKLSDGTEDVTVFVPTNDGLLHAISGSDDTTQGGGGEQWAFMPPELLSRLGTIDQKAAVTSRTYGLDGDIRVLRMDKNQDGVVDPSTDRVWLFFGMRMGGNHYYALDVTDRANPKLMWDIGPSQLPQVGQTWSAPVVTRVNVASGNDDTEKFVLIFGGGYDVTQETQAYSQDIVGNRVFMVDAKTGKLLWFAGGTGNASGTQPDLKLDDPNAGSGSTLKTMNNSIPARITVIDTNGDGFADRLYAGDMGGRVWRFDITNGTTRDKLVTGGVIAALGDGGASPATKANNRRFYNAADVSLLQPRGQDPFYNIAIGSGYRGHPLDLQTQERFYAIRDMAPYAKFTQANYNSLTPIVNADLVDATPTTAKVDKTSRGWRLDMFAAGKWAGEKVLSESVTVSGTVLFTTFEPSILGSTKGACFPSTTNRAYAVSAFSGKAALDFNDDKTLDDKDRYTELNQEGIVGDIQVALKRGSSADPNASPGAPATVCLAGMQVLKKCVQSGGTVRTFWNRSDAR